MKKSLVTLALLALAGCGSNLPANTYDLPPEEVYQRLVAGDLEDFKNRMRCGIDIFIQQGGTTNQSVSYRVSSGSQSVASFDVELVPVDGGMTEVKINLPPKGDGEIYDGTQTVARPAFRQPLRMGVEEMVASRIEGRAFNIEGMPNLDINGPCFMQKEQWRMGQTPKVGDPISGSRAYGSRDSSLSDDWGE
ncbi:hypothetical protein VCJ71_09040 [Alteriqipengyuania sp. WL0013]|uniref:hypothetical protein n=1 Tax=Alteriqipengyuania sp. WL0013 TaxID=3110773 RepID=UPI002C756C99|nr:hypothetical protein [Alteriqipengyuania sp. WL0013]MEB3416210.1 hypothetical protein [Alteriqipengyuania sp. WL0013]